MKRALSKSFTQSTMIIGEFSRYTSEQAMWQLKKITNTWNKEKFGLHDIKKELFLQSDWKTNIITKNIDQWKGHFSPQTKKELTNTDSKKECRLLLAVKYWKTAVQKEEKN